MVRLKTSLKSGIYQIVNIIDSKMYIGSAKNLKKRWKEHKRPLIGGSHFNKYLQRAWDKYGESNFKFKILCYCEECELLQKEQEMIDFYQSANSNVGYNLSPTAGSTLGLRGQIPWNKGKINVYREETLKEMGKGGIGRIPWNKGTVGVMPEPWNKDKKATPEMIKKLSDSHKGIKQSEEQKHNKSVNMKKYFTEHEHWNTGKHHSEDAKKAIGQYQKGRKKSKESVRKSAIARSKITLQYDLEGSLVGIYESRGEAAKAIGVTVGYLSHCISGNPKPLKGYIWKYAA